MGPLFLQEQSSAGEIIPPDAQLPHMGLGPDYSMSVPLTSLDVATS